MNQVLLILIKIIAFHTSPVGREGNLGKKRIILDKQGFHFFTPLSKAVMSSKTDFKDFS